MKVRNCNRVAAANSCKWNPVKELKDLSLTVIIVIIIRWNPVKELKEFHVDRTAHGTSSQWNPVKELKVYRMYNTGTTAGAIMWNPVKELKVNVVPSSSSP